MLLGQWLTDGMAGCLEKADRPCGPPAPLKAESVARGRVFGNGVWVCRPGRVVFLPVPTIARGYFRWRSTSPSWCSVASRACVVAGDGRSRFSQERRSCQSLRDMESRSVPPQTPRMGRRAPPFMRWDQRGRRVLQATVKLTDGSTMRVMLDTDDTEIAQQRIRPLIVSVIADGLLPAESRPARLYGVYDRPDFWAEMSRLAALGQAQYDAERAAAEKRFDLPVWIIDRLAKREARPVGLAAYRQRRFRARQRGEQTAMGTSWHHRPQGEKYFFRNGRVMNGRLHLECRVYQWSLKTRDAEVAAAIIGASSFGTGACTRGGGRGARLRARHSRSGSGSRRTRGGVPSIGGGDHRCRRPHGSC